jgi:threonine synthase
MDIQVSSNFERLIFESAGRDASQVRRLMGEFAEQGSFTLSDNELDFIKSRFSAGRADEKDVSETLGALYREAAYMADPHTAVGVHAIEQMSDSDGPVIGLATAHPAKFPEAVAAACNKEPDLPDNLARQLDQEERFTVLPNDFGKVSEFIEERSRAASETSL